MCDYNCLRNIRSKGDNCGPYSRKQIKNIARENFRKINVNRESTVLSQFGWVRDRYYLALKAAGWVFQFNENSGNYKWRKSTAD